MKNIARPVVLSILVSMPAFAEATCTLTAEITTGQEKICQGPPGDSDDNPNGSQAEAVAHTNGQAVSVTPSSSDTLVIGIRVASIGGAGFVPVHHDNGGNGGDGNEVTFTNSAGSNVTIYAPTSSGANLQHGVIGLLGSSRGGDGADPDYGEIDHYGGTGGSSANVTVTSDATVSLGTSSTYLNGNDMGWGVVAQSIGGTGGDYTKGVNTDNEPTGAGGNSGTVTANVTGDVSVYWSPTPSTACSRAFGVSNCSSVAAVVASSVGGTGGVNIWTGDIGGDGGDAAAATATVGVESASSVTTTITAATRAATQDNSAAILVMSVGGHGGDYGTDDGTGGNGGSSGTATANVYNTNVYTYGDSISGVQVLSHAGDGGSDADNTHASSSNGGDGGAAGTATANLSGSSVTTSGTLSYGVLVQSIGGLGGVGSNQGGTGTGGYIVNANLDDNSSVTTSGDYAAAVVAQSLAGAGGSGGAWTSWIDGNSGNGGSGGGGGQANADTTGTLITTGSYAHGVLVQSIGGSGGTGATASGVVVALGGSGGGGGDGNDVTGKLGGSITTSGTGSIGGLVQSIGGGGGNAGSASGVISVGGSGGSASQGGSVTVDLSGAITTTGEAGIGALGQSIGGGGGNAGSAAGVSAVGGNGGDGGNGSSATMNLSQGTDITTSGLYAHGAVIQSIGGGGGNGGSVFSLSAGSSVAPPALGGNSGGGGTGEVVNVTGTSATIATSGHGAVGLLAQAIGGGGGTGGSSTQDSISFVSLAIGGAGGSGGNSDNVTVNMTDSSISTQGIAAPAIVAQSIGGGGGNGGSANGTSAGAFINADMTIGGSGGNGGGSGTVEVDVTSSTVTTGGGTSNTSIADSYGILAQAIGGGGGNGGNSHADSLAIAIPTGEGSVAISSSIAIGGSGGSGGNGGILNISVLDGSHVSTGGIGSHGVLAQTVGGGGGSGGASHAMSTTSTLADDDALQFTVKSTLGGNGANGGDGGQMNLHVDGTSSITTNDDFSNAFLAQSIGGGGGNAGVGSSKSGGAGQAINATIALGSTGGKGGDGGEIITTLDAGSLLQTYGSGSRGMVLQSIGGGGGASQGGTVKLSGSASGGDDDDDSGYKASVSVSLGATGTTGGDGGNVTLNAQGAIATTGGDADGILVQSIGGGGGLAGSAGGDAGGSGASSSSSDGVMGDDDDSNSYDLSLAVGGNGGIAGGGGEVSLMDFTGTISTQGTYADGLVIQSIGGGGGAGGTATASGVTGATSIVMAVGGKGGAAGNGGAVTLDFQGDGTTQQGAISTTGDVAYGVLVQSIGGGGGQGADGSANTAQSSDSTSSVTLGSSGSSPNGGWGNTINTGDNASALTVSTQGMNSHAVVLQSIGGGGGTASVATLGVTDGNSTPNFDLTLGGGGGKSNSGATSPVTSSWGGHIGIDAWLNAQTSGEHAFGLVAQSIGGGGGIVASGAASNVDKIAIGGGATGQSLNGGSVNITIGSSGSQTNTSASTIATTGKGAHGVVVQSIGGGGGIAGYTANGALTAGWNGTPSTSTRGDASKGGDVIFDYSGTLTTSGDGAFGIIAQSIADGGGLAGDSVGSYAGSAYNHSADGAGGSTAGNVTIDQSGTLSVTGNNAYAIFAQSDGNVNNNSAVNVNIYGKVSAQNSDTDSGGVWVDGTAKTYNVTIASGASLSVPNTQYAIKGTRNASTYVTNYGQVSGSLSLSEQGVALGTAENFGTLLNADNIRGHVINHGDFLVGQSLGAARTHITGDFTQTAQGTLQIGADFIAQTADVVQVDGTAQLNGKIRVNSSRLMPNRSVVFLQSDNIDPTATPQGASSLIDYVTQYSGNQATVTTGQAHFDTLSESYGAGRNLRELGTHLQDIWARGGSEDLAGLYATLDQASQSASGFKDALSSLSAGISAAPAALKQADMARFAGSLLSCPHYEGTELRLSESSCVWGQIAARTTSVDGSHGTSSFDASGVTYQVGVQTQIAPQWFVGLSAAYENGHIKADDGRQNLSGDTGYLGASLKYENGPWMVAGTLTGSYGSYDSTRRIQFPGVSAKAESSPDVMSLGQRLRVAYTHNMGNAYIKPVLDLDLIYTRMPSYSEHGAGELNLNYESSDNWAAILTPGVEVGSRIDLNKGYVLRPYLNVGLSLSSTDHWDSYARLDAAPGESRAAKSTLDAGRTFGRVTAGLQLYGGEQFDVRLQYDGLFSSQVDSHGGSLKASWRY